MPPPHTRGVLMRTVSAIAGILLLPCVTHAQPLPGQQKSLRQLVSLRVEVQLVGVAARIGVSRQGVRDSVETRLRETGVDVLADDGEARGDPTLRVTLHAIEATGGYAFLVSVQLIERVVSLRRYVELVLSGELPTTPTDPVDPPAADGGGQMAGAGAGNDERGPCAELHRRIGTRVCRPIHRRLRRSESGVTMQHDVPARRVVIAERWA